MVSFQDRWAKMLLRTPLAFVIGLAIHGGVIAQQSDPFVQQRSSIQKPSNAKNDSTSATTGAASAANGKTPVSRGEQINPNGWAHEVASGRFRIHCDFRLTAEQALLRELSEISEDVTSLLKLPKTSETIHIVLFATEAEYRRYMENYFPTLPRRRALFIQDRGPGMLFTHWHQNVASDLRHEVTHALLNRAGISLPLWLDEGLAEYFERKRGERFLRQDYVPSVVKLTESHSVPTIHILERKSQVSNLSNADYRDSWAWVHFMIHRSSKTRSILIRYLQETLAHRGDSAGIFDLQRALWDEFPDLHMQLQEHFSQVLASSDEPRLAKKGSSKTSPREKQLR
ncbi:MAG: hypothetical protein AAF483_22510 [Planctomycetota bacterium]